MGNDKIGETLGLRPMEEAKAEIQPEETFQEEKSIVVKEEINPPALLDDGAQENLDDLEEARQNIKNVMETGDEALREILEIAKQSEQPRAFEVVSTLMKTMLEANKDLADISTKKRFIKEEINGPKEAAQTNVTNNNLIVSTADLLKMIKGENEDG